VLVPYIGQKLSLYVPLNKRNNKQQRT